MPVTTPAIPTTPAALRVLAAEYDRKADAASNTSVHASDSAPGAYVTGGSGRTRAQNRKTEQALDRTIRYAKRALYWRGRAAEMRRRAVEIETAPQRATDAARQQELDQAAVKAAKTARHAMPPADRLFVGCYPTGFVYADKSRERNGDYWRLGYQSYRTLCLELDADCPAEMRPLVEAHAAQMQARRGEQYRIAGNMTVVLGG